MQQSGLFTVQWDGNTLRTEAGGASIDIGGEEREGAMTDQRVFYFKEKLNPAIVKGTVVHCSDTDLKSIRAAKNIEVQFMTDTGVVYTVANAVCGKVGELKDGKVEITFIGSPA